MQFKTDKLFISGIFHLIFFLLHLIVWVTEPQKLELQIKEDFCTWHIILCKFKVQYTNLGEIQIEATMLLLILAHF